MPVNSEVAKSLGNILPFDHQGEIEAAVEKVRFHTMVTFARLATNYQMAAFCQEARIPGAFVECGAWKGGASGIMAIATLGRGEAGRKLHLFDSFDDICEPDELVDGERAVHEAREWAGQEGPLTGQLRPMSGFYDQLGGPGSAVECRELIVEQIGFPESDLSIHEGWFQDTIPNVDDLDEIAILRLDCDFYQATRYCLEQLFDRVVPGGFVIVDDYGWYEGCRRAVDEFLGSLPERYFLNHADADCRYLIKK